MTNILPRVVAFTFAFAMTAVVAAAVTSLLHVVLAAVAMAATLLLGGGGGVSNIVTLQGESWV